MLRLPQEVFNGRSNNHNEAEAETRVQAGEAQHQENEVAGYSEGVAACRSIGANRRALLSARGHRQSEPPGAPFVSRAGPAPGSFL